MRVLAASLLATASAKVYFEDNFDAGIGDKWVPSEWKDAESTGKWVHTAGEWYAEGQEAIAKGMQASEDMKFHSISAPLDSEATTVDAKAFGATRPTASCSARTSAATTSRGTSSSSTAANLLKEEEIKLDYADKDEFTHLYTMVLEADGSYEVFFDQPEDWVDTKKIPDPAAAKPEGYDDIPAEIPDPDAETPEDWDEDEDGEWEPMIDNPEFKGEWKAPMIENRTTSAPRASKHAAWPPSAA
ncbi:hypothetical protein JL720_13660 [Aureococcus anophagefferens]|nr:hypothetical protein JL720_13660 [Aureococcus anophagefferens]